MDEQFITAQTLAASLIQLETVLNGVDEKRRDLQTQIRDCESKLLDSVKEGEIVSYKVGGKAVTVIKKRGRCPEILISDLVSL